MALDSDCVILKMGKVHVLWTNKYRMNKTIWLLRSKKIKEIINIKLFFFLFVSFNFYLKHSFLSPKRWDIQIILFTLLKYIY